MRLIDCYIENFGTLSDYKIKFDAGLNTILAENGYGKTTLSVFIKSMFYGLDTSRRTKYEENDRKLYSPWQKGRFGGSLTFEYSGKEYRIERTFMPRASDDTFALYDVKTGKLSEDFDENLGVKIFEIDVGGFLRTVFLSEANLSAVSDSQSIATKLSDLVGVDGDLSNMDEAIDLLENQRKIYSKRGGHGEIAEIKNKKSVLRTEINDIVRKKEEITEAEESLQKAKSERKRLTKARLDIEKERAQIEKRKIQRGYEKQYLSMKNALDLDKEKLNTYIAFFRGKIPTQAEIDTAKSKLSESERIIASASERGASEEFTELSRFFENAVSDSEFIEAEKMPSRIREKNEKLKALSERLERESYEPQNVNKNWRTSLLLASLPLLLGIILGAVVNPILFTLSSLALPFLLHSFRGMKSNAKLLSEMKEKEEKREGIYSEISKIKGEIDEITRSACQFISKFPLLDKSLSIEDAIPQIIRKKDLYSAIYQREREAIEKSERSLTLARAYRLEAEKFLSCYPTKTAQPFDEIIDMLTHYKAQSASVSMIEKTIKNFTVEHGIDPENLSSENEDEISANAPVFNEEEYSQNEREIALIERRLTELYEQTEGLDALYLELEELSRLEESYEEKLSTIRATQKFLQMAKDSLTAKYLGSTKSAFDRIISAISGEDTEDFKMDTSFAIMKNEKGSYKAHEQYSKGTRDLYSLATRLALVESIYEKEKPFLILDDPLAYFDDKKFKEASKIIKNYAKDRQVIYLTCTDARAL